MRSVAIKFCGIATATDAAKVSACYPSHGLSHVGLVFWPKSKRFITHAEAREIRRALDPTLKVVGVFVDADVDEIVDLYEDGIISIAQLHGCEDESFIRQLREEAPELEIWKAFIIEDADDIQAANDSIADIVLLDGGKGEGNAFPHELLVGMKRPYALAGGLTPGNVGDVMRSLNDMQCEYPSIVDVSSGIEASKLDTATNKPRKDDLAMQMFLDEVGNAANVPVTSHPADC